MMEKRQNSLDEALSRPKPTLICYLPLGDPAAKHADPATYLSCGVDVLEVGVATMPAVLDGPAIWDSMNRAIAAGLDNERAAEEISTMKKDLGGPATVWMTYPSADGPGFRSAVQASGADGLLVAGARLGSYAGIPGVHEILFVPHRPSTQQIADATRAAGYVMVAAADGVSGPRDQLSTSNSALLSRLRTAGVTVPLALGFGITDWRSARNAVQCGADAVVVGTATLVAAMDSKQALKRLLTDLRSVLDE